MTSGWGVDATLNGSGVPTSGTDDVDVRKVWGALYTPGIISGCAVTTSPSAMTYTVASGVVAIKTATGEVVMAPVQGTSIATTAAPGTGSRVDIIYAKQKFPDIEGDSNIVIGVATTLPDRAQTLARYTVSAGNANTNAATKFGAIDFSIPYGASLGRLHYWQNTYNGVLSDALLREGHGTFSLPTDRQVKFSVNACISALGASGFDNTKYVEMGFVPTLDNTNLVLWTTPGLHQAWQTVYFERTVVVTAGTHTVNLGTLKKGGPGQAMLWYGMFGDGYMRSGLEFLVEDIGPVK